MGRPHEAGPDIDRQAAAGGGGGLLSNLFQAASQVSEPTPRSYQPQAQAPVQLAPIPSGGGYRPPPPTRASAPPPNPNARPEAAAGLDGWFMDRMFGGNR